MKTVRKMALLVVVLSLSQAAIAATEYPISIVQRVKVWTIAKHVTVKTSELSSAFAEIYPSLSAFAKEKGISLGTPYARYFKYEATGSTELEAGFLAFTDQTLPAGIIAITLPGGRAVTTRHTGPYDSIGPAYEALHQWMTDHHLTPTGAPWEFYLNDPAAVPPSEIQTDIYFPID